MWACLCSRSKKKTHPREHPGSNGEVGDKEIPANGLDDDIVCKVEPLGQGEAAEEEPIDGWDNEAHGRVAEVVGALGDLIADEFTVEEDGGDDPHVGEEVEGFEQSWVQRHFVVCYVQAEEEGYVQKGEGVEG